MEYAFRFGLQGPGQWIGDQVHGWEGEDSEAFFIEADSEDRALDWGREAAEVYVRRLFEEWGWTRDIPSWKEEDFSHWIETDPEVIAALRNDPEVQHLKYGELPRPE